MSLRVRAIGRDEHLAFVASRPSASHMQVPSWGEVKPDWRAQSLGWFDENGRLVGAGLVLFRPLPKLKRYLAYLPEGPVVDWFDPELEARWLESMLAYVKAQGAFSVKMGPLVVVRRWSADAVKAAIADPGARRLRDAEATAYELRAFDGTVPHGLSGTHRATKSVTPGSTKNQAMRNDLRVRGLDCGGSLEGRQSTGVSGNDHIVVG